MKESARRAVLSVIASEPDDDSTDVDGWLKHRSALRATSAHSTVHPGRRPGRLGFERWDGK